MPRTVTGDKLDAIRALSEISERHPEESSLLLPIVQLLSLEIAVVELGQAVDEHGSLIAAKIAGDPRV